MEIRKYVPWTVLGRFVNRFVAIGIGGLALFGTCVGLAQTPEVALGQNHTLAVTPHGRVIACGNNTQGELGDGTVVGDGATGYRKRAIEVPGLRGIIAVAAGRDHSVALAADGRVWTWGRNNLGQLGNGDSAATTPRKTTPVLVVGLPDAAVDPVVGIAAGGDHTLVRTQTGKVYAWGSNSDGQLGINVTPGGVRTSAHLVSIALPVTFIAAGEFHSLAIKSDKYVLAWGKNTYGQLGVGDAIDKKQPNPVGVISNVVMVAAGKFHSIALVESGGVTSVYTWGRNQTKQLGLGLPITAIRQIPVKVSALDGQTISMVACGANHSVVIDSVGIGWGWGENGAGQLGDGTTVDRGTPTSVFPAPPSFGFRYFENIYAGWGNTAGFKFDGSLSITGGNATGQLGNNAAPTNSLSFTYGILPRETTPGGGTALYATIGDSFSLGVTPTSVAMRWGDASGGVVKTPSPLLNLPSLFKAVAGLYHSAYLLFDGSAMTRWEKPGKGYMYFGQMGNDYPFAYPDENGTPATVVDGFGNVRLGFVDIAAGDNHTIALAGNGEVWTWGKGPAGGPLQSNLSAEKVAGISNVTAIAARFERNYVVKADGTAWWWGDVSSVPVQLPITNVKQLTRGIALLNDGTVWACDTSGATWTQIPNLSDIKDISAGDAHWLALHENGSVWAWGRNTVGQLGNGSSGFGIPDVIVPERVVGLANVISISAGYSISQAVQVDGTLWSWGLNDGCELGDGTRQNRSRPVVVLGFDYRDAGDLDGDGLADTWEMQYFGDLFTTDGFADQNFDADFYNDREEYDAGTNPTMHTTPEVVLTVDPNDADGDGLTNEEEQQQGTNSSNPDSDNDGMTDGLEVGLGLNPLLNDANGDVDGDGVSNRAEALAGHPVNNAVNLTVYTKLE